MLTVAKVTQGVAVGYADYLEGKTQDPELGDYYLEDGERVEAPGRWVAGADVVGADAQLPVAAAELRALMAVRRPDTGVPLRKAGASGEAVAALDATFSAPKSVSAIWAVADPVLRLEIEWAHEQAIDRALEYSLKQVPMIRERLDAGTVVHAKPKQLIGTSWRHTTARAVDGQLPDPQLHSHVLLHAAVRRDGRIVAIDSRSWLVHQRELGAAYRTELARELSRLGFEIERETGRGGRYFEVAGVPQELIDRWSSRHKQVRVAIEERLADQQNALRAIVAAGGLEAQLAERHLALLTRDRQLAPKEERLMATATRSGKTPVTHRDLDTHWQRTASRHRLDRRACARLRTDRPPISPAGVAALVEGLTEFDATFHARDARAVALERSVGTPIADALERLRELREADQILLLADGTGTTREHRSRERQTVAVAERLADGQARPLASTIVAGEVDRLDRELRERGGRLSDEQRQAIELACGARRFVMIEGHAGTGKSTTLIGIARAHQTSGQEILVTSTAALAAERLAGELARAGVDAGAYSTAALHAAIDSGRVQLAASSTIIHDEAALASTREQRRLLAVVDESGARLIEVGDPHQNQPVGAGGLWTHLEQAAANVGAHVELTRNQRALDPADRHDQALFRDGEHERAIRGYAARERIHLALDESRVEDRALEAAQADRAAGKTTIVIAQTSNDHLDELNARAQAIREQNGDLGREALQLPRRPYRIRAGDEIQIRRTINHPEHGQLRNGTTATVADAHSSGVTLNVGSDEVCLSDEQVVLADLRLAYVQHPFPAQGITADTAHLIVGEHATREGSYVALSRAREETHIYATDITDTAEGRDRLAALSDRMSRTEPDVPSIRIPLAHQALVTEITPATADRDIPTGIPEPSRAWPSVRTPAPLALDHLQHASSRSHGWEP